MMGPWDKTVILFSREDEIFLRGDLIFDTQDMVIGFINNLVRVNGIITVEVKAYKRPIMNIKEDNNTKFDTYHCYTNHIRSLTTEEEFLYQIHGAYVLRAE